MAGCWFVVGWRRRSFPATGRSSAISPDPAIRFPVLFLREKPLRHRSPFGKIHGGRRLALTCTQPQRNIMARYAGAQPRPTVIGIARIVGTSRSGKREVVWGRPDLSDRRGRASATDEALRLMSDQRAELERDYHDLTFGYEVLTGALADAV